MLRIKYKKIAVWVSADKNSGQGWHISGCSPANNY